MIFAYSGFALLARTAAQPPQDTIDVTTPVVTRDNADSSTTGAVELVLPEEGTQTPATPPTSSLDFSL